MGAMLSYGKFKLDLPDKEHLVVDTEFGSVTISASEGGIAIAVRGWKVPGKQLFDDPVLDTSFERCELDGSLCPGCGVSWETHYCDVEP